MIAPSLVVAAYGIGVRLPAIRAAPTRQRLDPLDLFARLLIEGGVAEVDVPVQARVRVILAFGGWVRMGCARLTGVHSDLQVCVGRVPGCGEHLRGHFLNYPIIIALILDMRDLIQYSYSKLVRKEEYLESLKEIRRRHGLSQIDLSRRSGVAQNTISDIETGRREPRPSTLRKLAKSLGVEVADFYPETSHPKVSAPSSPEEWLRAHGGHLLRLTDAELRREFRELPDEDRRDFMERLSREFGEIQAAYERERAPRAAVIQDAYALASGRFLLATDVSGMLKAYFVEEDKPEQATLLVGPRTKDILERLEEYLVEQETQEAYERNP